MDIAGKNVARMSKCEIRRAFVWLFIVFEGDRSYLYHLQHCVEARGIAATVADLRRGAFRRRELHDDPGSADQMDFCADLLESHHGAAGLRY